MKKLAIIVPYNEEYIDNFVSHFKEFMKNKNIDYTLFFIKQRSNRPLNKGKLFNIGYFLNKDKFDYFCFHDIDFIPVSDECDYSSDERPISLVTGLSLMEFGEQEKVQNFKDYTLPYDEYFGGAVLFSKKHFEKINGYSNEYWGFGYEDYDLLLRCVVKKLPVNVELEALVLKSYGIFNGQNSYIKIPATFPKIRNATNKSFTMSAWFYADGEPPYGADTDSNRCEYFIFGRPGYHTGLSYTHGGNIKGVIWFRLRNSSEKRPVVIQYPARHSSWHHVGLVVDSKEQIVTLYLNGKEAGKVVIFDGELTEYLNKPYYVGVGDPNISSWKNYFKGNISEIGLWSEALKEYEMELIYNKGIVNNKGEYTSSVLPVGVWDFRSGYNNIIFDMSGNGNHAEFYNVGFATNSIKNQTERYLPYRRNGYYGYISPEEKYSTLQNLMRAEYIEIVKNRSTFNKKIKNSMEDMNIDGLSMTKFRILNREKYQEKHEIIEVVI